LPSCPLVTRASQRGYEQRRLYHATVQLIIAESRRARDIARVGVRAGQGRVPRRRHVVTWASDLVDRGRRAQESGMEGWRLESCR